MPRVKGYTPDWLTKPEPGHTLFTAADDESNSTARSFNSPYTSTKKRPESGPRRTIARRGTEIFVANGKELKWGDLVYLKDTWESKQLKTSRGPHIKREDSDASLTSFLNGRNGDAQHAQGYRVSFVWRTALALAPAPALASVLLTRLVREDDQDARGRRDSTTSHVSAGRLSSHLDVSHGPYLPAP